MQNSGSRYHHPRTHSHSKHCRHHKSQERHYRSPGEQHSLDRRSEARKSLPDEDFEESELFVVDRRGDRKNVEYGSLHRYSVPSYHRSGSGSVIGARGGTKIDRDESSDKAIVLHERFNHHAEHSSKRPLSQKPKQSAYEMRVLKIKLPRVDEPLSEDAKGLDFIAFPSKSSLKRKRSIESPELAEDGQDYRSIEGQKKPNAGPEDEDLEFASDSDLDRTEDESQRDVRLRNAELFRAAKERPNELRGWKDLMAYQSQVVRPGTDISLFSPLERRTLSDLRVSVCERAFKHVAPSQPGHDELIVEMLCEYDWIWDTAKLSKKWNEAVEKNPTSSLLWLKYLDFLQGRSTDFTFIKCTDTYVKCLEALDLYLPQNQRSSMLNKVHTFLRFTLLLRDADFDELAISLWQVLLEATFFRPPELSRDKIAELASLEEWWEADVPRIGEANAVGWDEFYLNKNISERISCENRRDAEQIDLVTRLRLESQLTNGLNLPANADADDEDDPHRFVMFSDVKAIVQPMLGNVPSDLILNAWLRFFGLPSISSADTAQHSEWFTDPFLPQLHCRTESAVNDGNLMVPTLQNQTYTSIDLFRSRAFGHLEENTANFIRRALDLLTQRPNHSDELAEYYLAFVQCRASPASEAKKLAKRLLKARPNSSRLYNAYALVEANLGNYEKAAGVWRTAITAGFDQKGDVEPYQFLLWHSWFSTALHNRCEDEALGILISMIEIEPNAMDIKRIRPKDISSSQRLRAKRFLSEQVDMMLAQKHHTSAVLLMELRSWLIYMLSESSIDEVLTMFADHVGKVTAVSSKCSTAMSLLLQAKAEMVMWHIEQRRPFKPATLRKSINNDLSTFPDNSLLIQARDMARGSFSVDGLREAAAAATEGNTDTEPGTVSWHFAITKAIRRFEQGVGSRHSVRSLFSSSMLPNESRVKCSAFLWTMWLRFELALSTKASSSIANQKQDSKNYARDVLNNGMRAMPWHKIWAIEAVHEMLACDGITEKEARTVVEVLEERELRIRLQSLLS